MIVLVRKKVLSLGLEDSAVLGMSSVIVCWHASAYLVMPLYLVPFLEMFSTFD